MKKSILILLLLTGKITFSTAQDIHPKATAYTNEVYSDVEIYKTPGHIKMNSDLIKQVEVVKWDKKTSYPLLSSVPLKNKYNPALSYDTGANFNPANFNPLKYMFDMYNPSVLIYRVDNTDYIVKINPAKKQ